MPANIGISIQNYKIERRSMQHEILFIVLAVSLRDAENASLVLRLFRSNGTNVRVPPWTPKYFHKLRCQAVKTGQTNSKFLSRSG